MKKKPQNRPDSPWVLSMEWHDVLFLHWPMPKAQLSAHIPDSLSVETQNGTAWLGIVPFRMSDIHPRWLPSVHYLSNFPELNIRTYVTDGDVSGVWFFSLDASSWLSVQIARWTYSLNYYHAKMSVSKTDDRVDYTSRRSESETGDFQFKGWYEPTNSLGRNKSELEVFLTERYFLFSSDRSDKLYRGRIQHPSWELHEASCKIDTLRIAGHPSPDNEAPHSILYSPHTSVKAWFPVGVTDQP
jgi:uncharacterized protein YqjF (DUF2071 family)